MHLTWQCKLSIVLSPFFHSWAITLLFKVITLLWCYVVETCINFKLIDCTSYSEYPNWHTVPFEWERKGCSSVWKYDVSSHHWCPSLDFVGQIQLCSFLLQNSWYHSSHFLFMYVNCPLYSYLLCLFCNTCFPQENLLLLWGGSKGVINFPWIFLCSAVKSLLGTSGIYPGTQLLGLFAGLFSDAMDYCLPIVSCETTRTKWLVLKDHIGWSTGSPKLQLFQLSQHSHITNHWLVSSSAYFPWNMTLKYKKQLSEGSWDKILHSKSRTLFSTGDLSLEAIHQTSGSSFRDFFVKTTKES